MSFCVTHRSALDKNIRHIYSGLPGEIRLRSYGNSKCGALDVHDRVVEKHKRPPERFESKFKEYVPQYGAHMPRAPAFRTVSPREASEISQRLSRPTVMSDIRYRTTISRHSPRRSPNGRARFCDDEDEDQSELDSERYKLRSRERQDSHRRVPCKEWSDDESGRFYYEDEERDGGSRLANNGDGNKKEPIKDEDRNAPRNGRRDDITIPSEVCDTSRSESTNNQDTSFDSVYTDDSDDDKDVADDVNRNSPNNNGKANHDPSSSDSNADKRELPLNKSRPNKKSGSSSPRNVGKQSSGNYQKRCMGILEEIMKARVHPRKRKTQPVFVQPIEPTFQRKTTMQSQQFEKDKKKLERRDRIDNRLGYSPYKEPMPRVLIVYHTEVKPQTTSRKTRSQHQNSLRDRQGPHERGTLSTGGSVDTSAQSRSHTRTGTSKDRNGETQSHTVHRYYPALQPSRSKSAPSRAIRPDRSLNIRTLKKQQASQEGSKRKGNPAHHSVGSKLPYYQSDYENLCVVQTQVQPGKWSRFSSKSEMKKSNTRLQNRTTSKIIRDKMRWAPDNDKNLATPVKVVHDAMETDEKMKKQKDKRGHLDEGEYVVSDESDDDSSHDDNDAKIVARNERGDKEDETKEIAQKEEPQKVENDNEKPGKTSGEDSTHTTSVEPASTSSQEQTNTSSEETAQGRPKSSSTTTSTGSSAVSRLSSPRSPPNSPRSTTASSLTSPRRSQIFINRIEGSPLPPTKEEEDVGQSSEPLSQERGAVKEATSSDVQSPNNLPNSNAPDSTKNEVKTKNYDASDDDSLGSDTSSTLTSDSSDTPTQIDDGRAVVEQERGRLDHVVPTQNGRGSEFQHIPQKADLENGSTAQNNDDVTFTGYQVDRHPRGDSYEEAPPQKPLAPPAPIQADISRSTNSGSEKSTAESQVTVSKADISRSTNPTSEKSKVESQVAVSKADISSSTNATSEKSKGESQVTVSEVKGVGNPEYSSDFSDDSSSTDDSSGEYSVRSNDGLARGR